MKLRSDQQICRPFDAHVVAPALDQLSSVIVKQTDHWAFMNRNLAEIYFNSSQEVVANCHSRRTYDAFLMPSKFDSNRTKMASCHVTSNEMPDDVPNECLLDHWLATSNVQIRETKFSNCIYHTIPPEDGRCPPGHYRGNDGKPEICSNLRWRGETHN